MGEALGVRVEFYPSGEGSGLIEGSQIRYDAASGTVRMPSGAGGWEAERRILDAVVLQEGLGKVFGAEYDRMLSELHGSLSAIPGMEEAAGLGKAGEAGSREKLEAYLAKVSEVGTEPEAWDVICKGVSSMLERKGLDYPVHETEVMGLLYADAHRKEKSLFYGEEAHHARIVEAFEENLFRQCFPILSVSCFSDLSLFLRRAVFVLPRRVLASPLYRMSGLRETGKAG